MLPNLFTYFVPISLKLLNRAAATSSFRYAQFTTYDNNGININIFYTTKQLNKSHFLQCEGRSNYNNNTNNIRKSIS